MSKISVRFAPSPTGHFHIGGLRTAIYNYLFAKKNNGNFFLRIEDTDKNRSNEVYTNEIIEILQWIGLKFESQIIFQSQRFDIYRKYAEKLLNLNCAYKCFCSAEEIKERLNQNNDNLKIWKYDRFCLNNQNNNSKKEYVIRFKVPDGYTEFNDIIRGKIKINNNELEDFVLLKADGSPTYHLAVVVDDIEMNINYIIRGEDHISNTPKQILLYKALNKEIPQFAHIPLILGKDKTKLSKRNAEVSVLYYKKIGILPEALLNYLVFLGWSPKSNKEIFSIDELINLFDLKEVNKKGAVFDFQKLIWFNSQYIKNLDFNRFIKIYKENLNIKEIENLEYYKKIFDLLKERIKTINEFQEQSDYFFNNNYKISDEAKAKIFNENFENIKKIILIVKNKFSELNEAEFKKDKIEKIIREIAEENKIKAGDLIHPLRIIISGRTTTPGLFEIIECIGPKEIMKRLEKINEIKP